MSFIHNELWWWLCYTHTHWLHVSTSIEFFFILFWFEFFIWVFFIFIFFLFCYRFVDRRKKSTLFTVVLFIYLFLFFCVWTKNPRSIIIYFSVKWKVIWQKKFFVIAKFPWWKFEIYFLINDPLSIIIKNSEHMVCLVTILIIISIFFFWDNYLSNEWG